MEAPRGFRGLECPDTGKSIVELSEKWNRQYPWNSGTNPYVFNEGIVTPEYILGKEFYIKAAVAGTQSEYVGLIDDEMCLFPDKRVWKFEQKDKEIIKGTPRRHIGTKTRVVTSTRNPSQSKKSWNMEKGFALESVSYNKYILDPKDTTMFFFRAMVFDISIVPFESVRWSPKCEGFYLTMMSGFKRLDYSQERGFFLSNQTSIMFECEIADRAEEKEESFSILTGAVGTLGIAGITFADRIRREESSSILTGAVGTLGASITRSSILTGAVTGTLGTAGITGIADRTRREESSSSFTGAVAGSALSTISKFL